MFYNYIMGQVVGGVLDCGALGKIQIGEVDAKALQIIDSLVVRDWSCQDVLGFIGSEVWEKEIAPSLGENAELVAVNVFWWTLTFSAEKE